jgi:hypothetical protein
MNFEFKSLWRKIEKTGNSAYNVDWPRGRSLHSAVVYKNRYIVVIAGQSSVQEMEKQEFMTEKDTEFIAKKPPAHSSTKLEDLIS